MMQLIFEPCHENLTFAYAKTKMQIRFTVTAKLIRALVFATQIVQSLYQNPKFQASNYLLMLYSTVCVRPGLNPEDWFSQDKAHFIYAHTFRFILVNVESNKCLSSIDPHEDEISPGEFFCLNTRP